MAKIINLDARRHNIRQLQPKPRSRYRCTSCGNESRTGGACPSCKEGTLCPLVTPENPLLSGIAALKALDSMKDDGSDDPA